MRQRALSGLADQRGEMDEKSLSHASGSQSARSGFWNGYRYGRITCLDVNSRRFDAQSRPMTIGSD